MVHIIPNGEIKTLANRSKDYSYYVIDLGVDYDDDTDHIVEVVQRGGSRVTASDPVHSARSSSSRSK